ncbi:hypothetical protein CHUAL_002735 [Chamberlinius hualienensis]
MMDVESFDPTDDGAGLKLKDDGQSEFPFGDEFYVTAPSTIIYNSYENEEFNESKILDWNQTNPYYFYKTEQLTFLWILFIVIVMGNCAVLSALTLSKSKKSRMNFFIMHLAIADLSVGIISVLTDIVWKLTVSWYAGNSGCKIIRFLQCLVTYSSTYVLVALSIDRYDAITHPMNFSGSWKRAKWLIAIAWMLSAVFSAPIMFLYEERSINGQLQCWIELPDERYWQLYMTLVSIALFIIPTFIITACYTIIVYTIWSKGKILVPKSQTRGSSNASEQTKALKCDLDCKRASSRGLIPKAKIKTVKMTFAIVFVFIICWSPYILYDLLQVYGYIPNSQTNVAIATFIQSMAPLNSAANPMIYCFFSTHICRNLRQIPLLNWIAELACLCCPKMSRPTIRETTYSTRRSEYTTVSETLSRSSHRGTVNSVTGLRYGANNRCSRLNTTNTNTNTSGNGNNCIAIKEFKHTGPIEHHHPSNNSSNSQL